ncbi:MAG: hypothetical protein M1819_002671 [Sarea resinae]|nr:MAG: hypothetical protein M1819_002671 [Sarea resinae]
MSLTIKHINADTSFLLTFSPAGGSLPASEASTGAFSILIDPWLSGPSKIWHRKFSISHHRIRACVSSLAELPEPDLVLISQNKPDHCHRETLCQLKSSSKKTRVLAEHGAAKKIRRWKYFAPSQVQSLRRYEVKKEKSLHRIPIPASSPGGVAGEVAIAFISSKRDITGLHNAIGITYQAPSAPRHRYSTKTPLTPSDSSLSSTSSAAITYPTQSTWQRLERPVSVIYSPHGISYPSIERWAVSHLAPQAALPLTALLHSFDQVENPWWLGGTISAGLPGGIEIARNLFARAWISAHDEEKENAGLSVSNTKTKVYSPQDVQRLMKPEGKHQSKKGLTDVVVLGVGEELDLKAG